ncbi:hypothetical protein [Candidatus Poriferisodalis sp.]
MVASGSRRLRAPLKRRWDRSGEVTVIIDCHGHDTTAPPLAQSSATEEV